jgi:predicted membrane channel-forming protein YqfA (hemolysin III family)
MQFTTRSLFALTFACALLSGYVALPSDFKGLLAVSVVLLAGVAGCIYTAFAPHIPRSRVASIVIALALAFAVVILVGPLRTLFFHG